MAIIVLTILFFLIFVGSLFFLINKLRKREIIASENAPYGLDPGKISPTHAQVAGGLAGFTIAVVTLIVSLIGLDKVPPYELQITIMVFLLAFGAYVQAATLYATVPGRPETIRGFTFVLATYMYVGAQVLSIVAFQPLFVYLGYKLISTYLPFVPLLILVGGYFSAFSALSVLLGIRRSVCNIILLLVSAWVSLHFVMSRLWVVLWPDTPLPWIVFYFVIQLLLYVSFAFPMATSKSDSIRKLQRVFSITIGGLSLMSLEYFMAGAFAF